MVEVVAWLFSSMSLCLLRFLILAVALSMLVWLMLVQARHGVPRLSMVNPGWKIDIACGRTCAGSG